MADALTVNESWHDHTYISIAPIAGSEVQMRTKTTSLNITGGNYDKESRTTFGGTVSRYGAREDFEISFEGVVTSHQDFDWMFHGVSQTAASITSSAVVNYRVTMLWTDLATASDSTQVITTASEAYRESYVACNMISCEKSQNVEEDITANLTFKTAFEDSDGSINFIKEVCGTTSALVALSAYTTANKFR